MQTANSLLSLEPSYIREILAATADPEVISLAGGLPAEESFPIHLMSHSLATLSSRPELFQYGLTAGYTPLITFLRSSYRLEAWEDVMVCTGSQQALDLVARTWLNPGDGVAMEMPGYIGALQVFALAQARFEGVPQGPEGPDLDRLARLFSSNNIKLFYAVPDFHNPTGVCWSLETRNEVARLCRLHGVTLVEDSPYREIRFAGKTLPLVSSLCPEISLTLRSFSKTVSPGIRFGVVTAHAKWLSEMLKVKQAADLHSNIPMQAVLLSVLQHPGFARHIQSICDLYGGRYRALGKSIGEKLGRHCCFQPVDGGMFVWLKLPGGDAMDIARRCIEQKLAVVPGNVFFPDGKAPGTYLRLNFSRTPVDQFDEAIERLARCIKTSSGPGRIR